MRVTARVDTFDLGSMHLQSGEGRKLALNVGIEPFILAQESYLVRPALIPVRLDISRTTGAGYALRLRFEATLEGPCMRCLGPAVLALPVDVLEVSIPGETDDVDSPYVQEQILELAPWARETVALALPATVLCRPECAGLCATCGVNLNTAGPEHRCEAQPDPRWAKLAELHFH